MIAEINAILHILTVSIAIVLIRRYYFRPSIRAMIFSALATFFIIVLLISLNVHACNAGLPVYQIIIPIVSAGFLATFAKNKMKHLFIVLFIAEAIIFAKIYVDKVHSDEYTGNCDVENEFLNACGTSDRNIIETSLQMYAVDNQDSTVYSAGWVVEQPFYDKFSQHEMYYEDSLVEDVPVAIWRWYTPITGYYQKDHYQTKAWYAGGNLLEIYEGVSFKKCD